MVDLCYGKRYNAYIVGIKEELWVVVGKTLECVCSFPNTFKKESEEMTLKTQSVHRAGYRKPFASGLNFYKLFWIFFIGCFIGVVVETIFALVTTQKLESRAGVVYGPFNPVYGFGAVLMTVCLYKLKEKRDLWIFLCCMVIGAAFEYLCSLLQEVTLGTVSWQYDQQMFDIGGRTSLLYAFFWGILGLLWIKFLFPLLSKWIEKIPNKAGVVLTWIRLVFMVFNMAVSLLALERQAQRREGVPANNVVAQFFDDRFPDSRLDRIYRHMYVVDQAG